MSGISCIYIRTKLKRHQQKERKGDEEGKTQVPRKSGYEDDWNALVEGRGQDHEVDDRRDVFGLYNSLQKVDAGQTTQVRQMIFLDTPWD